MYKLKIIFLFGISGCFALHADTKGTKSDDTTLDQKK